MIRGFLQRFRKGNRMWWITAFAVMGFFLCVGIAMYLKYSIVAQSSPLPTVPSFIFNTSTPAPAGVDVSMPVSQPTAAPIATTSVPAIQTLSPSATATNFSILSWLSGSRSNAQATSRPSLTPIQVIIPSVTKTLTPSPVPSLSPSPSPQPSSIPISNSKVCKNILYPARPGSQWTYFINSPRRTGDVNMRVTSVDGQQATVDAVELNTGANLRTYVQCDQDVILNFPLLSAQKIIGNMIDGDMILDYVGGVLAPNEAAFNGNNWALSWNIQYQMSGSGLINFRSRDFQIVVAPSPIQMTCQTLASGSAAFESITVFAGTFNALKVICRGDGQVSATVNGSQVTGSVTAQATQWFAPNIGLLRSQSDYAYLNVFGISIPLNPNDVSGTLELRSYLIGQ